MCYVYTGTIKQFTNAYYMIAPLPVGHTAHTAVLLDGSVYVGGGYEGRNASERQNCYRLDVYNFNINQWITPPLSTPYFFYGMTILDDKLIIAGGTTINNEVTNKILVLDGGEWKDLNKMPTARSFLTAVGYQLMLITLGGQKIVRGKWTIVGMTEVLDTTTGQWYTGEHLPVPHRQLKAVVINNTLYVLGGTANYYDDSDPSPQMFTASLDNLVSHQLTWQSLVDTPWCCSTPVILYDKFLLTVGGRRSSLKSQTREVCAFNPSTGLWGQVVDIPIELSFPGVVSIANQIIVMGGHTMEGEFSCDTWIGVLNK